MKNIWLFRKNLKTAFPIGQRIWVSGPFLGNNLNDALYSKYLGESGTITEYYYVPISYHAAFFAWLGVVLDINLKSRIVFWLAPSEVGILHEDNTG